MLENRAPPAEPGPNVTALRGALLAWFAAQGRALPWRTAFPRDPYRVWVSEVLLQQTQVARGLPYYQRFVERFPSVAALAQADLPAVLKAWEGCGYYARARNLHRAAQQMAREGVPTTHAGWLALPGVGPYTAAAVSSIAFGEARAVVDGNVRRVLARLFAEREPTLGWVQAQADALLDPQRPGDWNEAVMDLGATVCTPRAPNCPVCPLTAHCRAFQSGQPEAYPAPKKRAAVREVQAVALLVGDAQQAYLERRAGPLLGGLWGLPLQEVGEGGISVALDALLERLGARQPRPLGQVTHTMTHRRFTLHLYAAEAGLQRVEVGSQALSRLDHKLLALANGAQPPLFGPA